ncbi:MAG: hypothetical protein ACJ75F_05365 [Flavisolibacter sp.]
MHFFDFILLREDEQLEMLWYNGEQIGRRRHNEFLIQLYQVEGFYVEVYYNTKYREIEKYLSFECTDKLEPYIRDIDLGIVYKCLKKRSKNPAENSPDEIIGRSIHQTNVSNSFWKKLKNIFRMHT